MSKCLGVEVVRPACMMCIKYSLLISLLLQLESCRSSKQLSSVGTYERSSQSGFERVEIKSDGTFKFRVATHLCEPRTFEGTWLKTSHSLLLFDRDTLKTDTRLSTIAEQVDQSVSGTEFRLVGDDTSYEITICIDGEDKCIETVSGIARYHQQAQKFTISSLLISYSLNHVTKNRATNLFLVSIVPDKLLPCDRLQHSKKFTVSGNQLIDFEGGALFVKVK